jgi:hypothetical protein
VAKPSGEDVDMQDSPLPKEPISTLDDGDTAMDETKPINATIDGKYALHLLS